MKDRRNRKGINLQVDSNLWRQVKAEAALDEKTAIQWVEEALRGKLAEGQNKQGGRQ